MKTFGKASTAMLVVTLATLTACSAGSPSGDHQLSKNQTFSSLQPHVDDMMTRPTSIGLSEKITEPIPADKTIAYIQCGAPSCLVNGDALESAAQTVGWSVDRINTDGTAESVKAAWAQANSSNPDAVVASGFSRSLFEPELAKLAAKNIPVIDMFVADKPVDGISAGFGYGDQWTALGASLADYMLVNSGNGTVNAASITISAYPNLGLTSDGMASRISDECDDCSFSELEVPVSSMGSDLPTRVTSYLSAHPNINWVYVGFADMMAGLPAALSAAGLGDVNIVTTNNTATTAEYLKSGQSLVMGTGFDNLDFMWRSVDFLIRYFLGMPTAANQDPNNLPQFMWTKENLPAAASEGSFPFVKDYKQQYKKLWGVDQ